MADDCPEKNKRAKKDWEVRKVQLHSTGKNEDENEDKEKDKDKETEDNNEREEISSIAWADGYFAWQPHGVSESIHFNHSTNHSSVVTVRLPEKQRMRRKIWL